MDNCFYIIFLFGKYLMNGVGTFIIWITAPHTIHWSLYKCVNFNKFFRSIKTSFFPLFIFGFYSNFVFSWEWCNNFDDSMIKWRWNQYIFQSNKMKCISKSHRRMYPYVCVCIYAYKENKIHCPTFKQRCVIHWLLFSYWRFFHSPSSFFSDI